MKRTRPLTLAAVWLLHILEGHVVMELPAVVGDELVRHGFADPRPRGRYAPTDAARQLVRETWPERRRLYWAFGQRLLVQLKRREVVLVDGNTVRDLVPAEGMAA